MSFNDVPGPVRVIARIFAISCGGGGYECRLPAIPKELPFLESVSWFDSGWREMSHLEMLQRYERSWRHLGVTADLPKEEAAFVRALAAHFGSVLDVPA